MTKTLSITEAAERMSITRRTLYRWLDDGRLPGAFKIPGRMGGEWRIPAADLDAIKADPPDPARRCEATTVTGRGCRSPAIKGSRYCRWHQKEEAWQDV